MFRSLALLSLSVLAGAPAAGRSPAHVLLVDFDDFGFDLLRGTPTPTLDWIEANGRAFTSFTTSPICSPTRAMIMTGAYPSHPDLLLGSVIRSNSEWSMPLHPLEPLPRIVADAGLTTAKIGKWHLASPSDEDHPNDAGWQHYAGVRGNVGAADSSYTSFPKTVNGMTAVVDGVYLTTDETDDAIACVRACVDLVSLSYHAPHRPWHTPPASLHTISPITSDLDRARAMVQAADAELGRLLREALARDYLVLVFGDNGTPNALGGAKGSVRDPGIVVPCFAIGPGVRPGVDATPIGAQDIYATAAEILGVSAGGEHRGPHSRSFVDALGGAGAERRWSYSERFWANGTDPRSASIEWRRAIRGERFKLVREELFDQEAFYDLAIDPMESNDLLGQDGLSPEADAALLLFRQTLDRL
ncbi:MAG: sulfatase-like hydrolase/transferase [Planctomycetota bacterium]